MTPEPAVPTPADRVAREAADRPRHPTAQAAVLLVVVTLAIVVLASLSAWGLI